MKIKSTQVRVGDILDMDGVLHRVTNSTHVTPGKGKAHMQLRLKNLETESNVELRMNSDDMAEKAYLESFQMVYQYEDGDHLVFMHQETYEQIFIHRDDLTEQMPYMVVDIEVTGYNYEGKVVSVELPHSVDLEIIETQPRLKGATATNSPKPATLETGLVVSVPPFVETGEKVRVDTRTGEYMERAS